MPNFTHRQLTHIRKRAEIVAKDYEGEMLDLSPRELASALEAVDVLIDVDETTGELPEDWRPSEQQRAWLYFETGLAISIMHRTLEGDDCPKHLRLGMIEDLELNQSIRRDLMEIVQ